ncbi:pecanex-like protein 1 isoform X2 [Agrilus planipennis]|uniref:Pecanex-like protein n=1 Tax=Agrilus planipennis TaxID=224129 RepID=A0A1W4WEJ0_AGRPL|nr:pecanex-like protein 1 isoform X2 [Agrilus planipennis]
MVVDQEMGSQTLEILRQGVWASLTGGWFYDPHQTVFCNTFHLYLWLFLFCLPFSIYLYLPPDKFVWYCYCGIVAVIFATIKLANYALHHMYDTTECIDEVRDEPHGEKREDEGIELQVLSKKSPGTPKLPTCRSEVSNVETSALPSTDVDSLDSEECQHLEPTSQKLSGIIDLKADVHRKNSSESSEGLTMHQCREAVALKSTARSKSKKLSEASAVSTKEETTVRKSSSRKSSNESKGAASSHHHSNAHHQSDGSEQGSPKLYICRRHSNFTNSSLSYIPTSTHSDIKSAGSVELGYIDKNPTQAVSTEGLYYKPYITKAPGVRRIRSTALEVSCPPPLLTVHPNSLEVIGENVKGMKSPLPPPSSTLIRNQHLNLCPYFGSEIVYPIAEQSDEHQTSHGPDSDLESLAQNSDSDYEEENNQGSQSPLLVHLKTDDCVKMVRTVRISSSNASKAYDPSRPSKMTTKCDSNCSFSLLSNKSDDGEQGSATSKDALVDNEKSNSSETPEMQDARADCYATDNEFSDRKFSDSGSSSCSDIKLEAWSAGDVDRGSTIRQRSRVKKNNGQMSSSNSYIENKEDIQDYNDEPKSMKRRKARKNSRLKCNDCDKVDTIRNRSSVIELDLDWLFDDGSEHKKRRSNDWSSTSVSLEHDVSKVLQEPTPSTRNLGAIPKKRIPPNRNYCFGDTVAPNYILKNVSENANRHKHSRRVEQSSSGRGTTQSLPQNDNVVEGLECLVVPARSTRRIRKLSSRRGNARNSRSRGEIYQEIPSGGSNAELSTLLPATPLFSAFLASRRDMPSMCVCVPMESPNTRNGYLKRSHRVHRRRVHSISRANEKTNRDMIIANTITSGRGTHRAKSFDDTSDGSVHCFLDEYGNWITYTFDGKGVGTANISLQITPNSSGKLLPALLRREEAPPNGGNEGWESNSTESVCNSSVSVMLENNAKTQAINSMIPTNTALHLNAMQLPALRNGSSQENLREAILDVEMQLPRNKFRFIQAPDATNNNYVRIKSYYKFKVFPWTYIKVTFDRLKLLALLDRNLTLCETVVSIILGVLVSINGAYLLHLGFYKDVLAFIFCFVVASCQYSLLKSVQPDAASPIHGFNRVVAYSRPIYFCLFSYIILLLHLNSQDDDTGLTSRITLEMCRDFFLTFLLFFPVIFSLGLFPQVNTFLMYLLEQTDMHLFGGNAMPSLLSSFYCIFRSCFAVIVMYGLAYGSLIEPKRSQHILFSMFCGCLVAISYHLSRSASDLSLVWNIVKKHVWPPDVYREYKKTPRKNTAKDPGVDNKITEKGVLPDTKVEKAVESGETSEKLVDPLPHKLQKTVNARLKSDLILCSLIAVLVFGIHASTVFTALQPELGPVLWCIAGAVGFILHYIVPQLRKQLPWLCIARPILRSHEYEQYQVRGPAKVMWFERVYVYLCFFERNILYPLVFLAALTEDSPVIVEKFGYLLGSLFVVVCGMRCLRGSYSCQNSQYLILTFTVLFFNYDYVSLHTSFLVDYFIMSFIYYRAYELLLKLQFVITYIAPWQITWGSAFHAFAQPFSVPHSAMLFLQAIVSAILSTPLNPFLGSAIFLTSYVRPVKFWERDYNTRRVDHSNTPLSSHLDRNLGADDNNLNSIFYEHLTRSLQHSLCGDLILGRWGPVNQGDCFVLASDYLNCLVHIIELGNGLVTFQMRGLEFRGTYCQQREVEAITEGVEENDGCCCCDPGHLPHMLSMNAAFGQRWLAWEVTAAKYVLEGYSISDNSAVSMLQVFDFRKVLITYYVKSIIFYTLKSPKLNEWLNSGSILKALQPMQVRSFADLDPVFNVYIDEDYDVCSNGMTKSMFYQVYGDWIAYCAGRFEKEVDTSNYSTLTLLCFALSLLGRRTLATVSHNTVSNVEFFLYGLHALFKGDFRITCTRDEWVFTDMDLLKTVVAPGVRMSLKLHQDHFMSPDEYDEMPALFDAICKYEEELVISHEGDPAWRSAVLSGTPSLLALRHVLDDGVDEYKIIMLNKRHLNFRVIKINRECVRGLWAGQQQELIYLRNRNPERGSIQNAKQALRNIINSSCDQPIGYPIYVSPLTTSYAETNEQLCGIIGGSLSLSKIRNTLLEAFGRVRKHCREGCSSGGSRDEIGMGQEGVYAMTPITALTHHTAGSQSTDGSHFGGSMGRGASLSRTSLGGNRGSLASMGKPTSSTLASLAGLFKERDERAVSQLPDGQNRTDEKSTKPSDAGEKENTYQRVKIIDPNVVYDCINLGRRIDVSWPDENMRAKGGRSHWRDWLPETGMEGQVVHRWSPCHWDPSRRSHVDRTILLVKIDDKYVPIAESGVQDLGAEV